MRWLWVDRFLEFRSGQFARAVKNVSMAEEQFRDHFPGYPLMPGSLIIEGMAQTGGILVAEAKEFKETVVLAKLSRVDFSDSALPGDQITYEARLTELREEGAAVEAKAFVNGRPLATAEIVFGHVSRPAGSGAAAARYDSFRHDWMDTLGVPRRGQPADSPAPTPPIGAVPK
ncbi:MAG: beta-hydroxyacyl-ACP dehydratase [Planctomycetes bacterium]|nr:beta-hydroxyacyl-ACP dehydratase [Planctomycetota bacterium]